MTACVHSQQHTVIELVRAGAAMDHQEYTGKTALMFCQTTKLALVDAKAQLEIVDQSGRTALMLASANGNLEIARFLFLAQWTSRAQVRPFNY